MPDALCPMPYAILESIDRYPVIVTPETLLADAIALMSQTRNACPLPNSQPLPDSKETTKTSISCVLVIDRNQLVGLLSERDVVNLTTAEFCLQGVKVAEVMTRKLIAIKESEFVDVFTALNLFCQHSIDYLPIVDDRGQLVGLVTPYSIRQEVAKLQQKQRELLDSNSELEKQVRELTAQLQQQLKCVSDYQAVGWDVSDRKLAEIALQLNAELELSYRKRAEFELQQLKERLQLLLTSNPAVIFTLQPAGDFATTYISDNVRAIVGYSSEECLADAHFWSSRIHPEDIMQFLVGFANLSGPENHTCEYRFLHRDGLYRWLRTELKLLVDSKGEPIEIIGYAADISNSKCAEIAWRQQFEQEQLVESIARRVRQSLELAEILNTTVAELQQILAVDRVMVYQLLPDGSGKVIAEVVADGCSHILNRVFVKEVFPPENYQHYLEGRICAISERDGRGVTPCLVDFMQEIEVRAKLVAPIVQLNQLWGLLISHQCDRPREWQEWEINLFQQLANQLAIAIQQSLLYQQLQSELNERKQAEENLKNSLKEKEILLKEIHHRVKNNLCVVASLLELQSDTVADSQLAKMLAESQNRLYSMALIHEKLYRSKNLRQINFGEYIEDLVTNLFQSYNINDNRIQLQVFAEPILLNIETATPCGLIVNELVSNTLKHAFPNGTSGTVSVECYQTGDREIHLFVKDNGTGFPKNLDFRKTGSMGFQVVCTLTEQLEGTIELSGEIGTLFHLKFNELKYFSRL